MKLFILLSVVAAAAALTEIEIRNFIQYEAWYGFGDTCDTMEIVDSVDNPGHYLITSTGVPNHPTHQVGVRIKI